jgi:hypothetical protein
MVRILYFLVAPLIRMLDRRDQRRLNEAREKGWPSPFPRSSHPDERF